MYRCARRSTGGRHRRGEEQRLALAWASPEDAFDGRAEPDVEHAVGFIEHCDLQVVQVQIAALQKIDDATGSADDDRRRTFELANLFADRLAADQKSRITQVFRRQPACFIGHLLASSRVGHRTRA